MNFHDLLELYPCEQGSVCHTTMFYFSIENRTSFFQIFSKHYSKAKTLKNILFTTRKL